MQMYKCSKCGKETKDSHYDYTGVFVCKSCAKIEPWHTDRFSIEDGIIIRKTPYEGLTEEQQREKFIEFAFNLLGGLDNRAYALMKNYAKKYSWLDMTRALEYFYLIKRNPVAKANKNVGIIPHVIEDSQKFYKRENMKIEVKTNAFIEAVKKSQNVETKVFEIKEKEKNDNKKIDLSSL